jgi:hypothetical protein
MFMAIMMSHPPSVDFAAEIINAQPYASRTRSQVRRYVLLRQAKARSWDAVQNLWLPAYDHDDLVLPDLKSPRFERELGRFLEFNGASRHLVRRSVECFYRDRDEVGPREERPVARRHYGAASAFEGWAAKNGEDYGRLTILE